MDEVRKLANRMGGISAPRQKAELTTINEAIARHNSH